MLVLINGLNCGNNSFDDLDTSVNYLTTANCLNLTLTSPISVVVALIYHLLIDCAFIYYLVFEYW